ncbi:unnamed protein product [Didymodactylos carnosus]|uniref:Hemerythrin-like domain-containing protein n=1 Tax=Didymodactylos carnosus TaxID=1234261 RepID=A0A8S2CZY0_9BILA|nr:unnamed protein product [Didymodactylos carnosus]CAF3630064.1 unnamed protein product [Didymodactylos carnosus]
MSISRTTGKDIFTIIIEEHRLFEQLYQQYKQTVDFQEKHKIVYMLVRELCIHSHKEALILYPVVKSMLENGAELIKDAIKEHREIERLLSKLDSLHTVEQFTHKMDELVHETLANVFIHIREEEAELIPSLRKVIEDELAVKLGRQFEAATKQVSSRPHPDAPMEGEAALLADRFEAPMDKLADEARFGFVDPASHLNAITDAYHTKH